MEGTTGNSDGEGVSKAKVLKESRKLKWNFQKGGRGGEDMDIFWNNIMQPDQPYQNVL